MTACSLATSLPVMLILRHNFLMICATTQTWFYDIFKFWASQVPRTWWKTCREEATSLGGGIPWLIDVLKLRHQSWKIRQLVGNWYALYNKERVKLPPVAGPGSTRLSGCQPIILKSVWNWKSWAARVPSTLPLDPPMVTAWISTLH